MVRNGSAYSAAVAGCRFCDIIAGDRAAHMVLEDDVAVAFLDIRPLFPGHTLVVPREHYVTLAELPDEAIGGFFTRVKLVARAVEHGLGAEGSFVAQNNRVSQSVAHLHVHVVPRTKGDGLRGFFWPRTKYGSEDEAAAVAGRLARSIESLEPLEPLEGQGSSVT
jgi:histidine triad (HIT) family protein